MTEVPVDERLAGAWTALLDIKDEKDFWRLYEGIEVDVLDGLEGDDRDAAIEGLNAYLAQLGRAEREGFV